MASLASTLALAVALASAPTAARDPSPDVSLGTGWTVAQVRASLDAPPGPTPPPSEPAHGDRHAAAEPEPEPVATPGAPPPPRVSVRPYAHHSDLDARIKEARRARALQIGAALAVQGAMVIYGITRAIDNAKEAEIIRDEPPPSQFKPMHPR